MDPLQPTFQLSAAKLAAVVWMMEGYDRIYTYIECGT